MDFVAQMGLNHGNDSINKNVTISADTKDVYGDLNDPLLVPAASTLNVSLNVDPDSLAAYYVFSTVDLTLTTTNSAGIADVVSIVANEPVFWHNKMGLSDAARFANRNPWTNLAFANAGATEGQLQMIFARDGTS
jgi:hypothetical protein